VLFLYGLIVGQESAANFVPANTADDILAPLFLAVCGDPAGTAGDLSVSSALTIEETLGFAAPSHLSTRSHDSGCKGSRGARCKNESRPSTRGTSCQIRRPSRPRTTSKALPLAPTSTAASPWRTTAPRAVGASGRPACSISRCASSEANHALPSPKGLFLDLSSQCFRIKARRLCQSRPQRLGPRGQC